MRILHLDLDTLRPDHLGCYGYARNTSPVIDSIARDARVFEGCYVTDAPCLPARASLFSGRFGIHNGAINHGGSTADMDKEGPERGFRSREGRESLVSLIRKAGYHTVTVSPFGERHSSFWFYSGFNEIYNTGSNGNETAGEITPVVMDWLERNAGQDNWYLHVNYWDPHTPYRAPLEFGDPFRDDPLPEWITPEEFAKQLAHVGPHGALEIGGMFTDDHNPAYPRHPGKIEDMDGVRQMIDGYDCGIRYMDEHIGRIVDFLKAQGIYEDTAIIVSSDHGENLGELGLWAEHGTADYVTTHIPLIIKWPGMCGGRDSGLHYQIDLLPTLADLMGVEPFPSWDGASYAPSLKEGTDCGRSELIVSQCAHVCQRGVRFDDWMYIRTYHDGYHLFPKEMLFNVKDDPHEVTDVAAEHPDVLREAAWRLLGWHDEMMAGRIDAVDPLWQVIREGGPYHARGELKAYTKRLEETGRGWAIPELKKRHPQEFR